MSVTKFQLQNVSYKISVTVTVTKFELQSFSCKISVEKIELQNLSNKI